VNPVRTSPIATLCLLTALAIPSMAEAGGLFLTDRGVRPMGRGFASVAGADDPQALWYNPANIGLSGQQLMLDASLLFFRGSVTRIDSGDNVLPTVEADTPLLPLPGLAFTQPVGDFTLGLGLAAPYALLTSMPDGVRVDGSGACDYGAGEDPTCEPSPTRYSLYSLDGSSFLFITPAVSWEPIEGLHIGAGVNIVAGAFVGETAISGCDGFVCTQPENPDWDGRARFTLNPLVEVAVIGGVTYDHDIVRVSASFQWFPTDAGGSAELDVRLPSAAIFDGATVDGNSAELTMPLPTILRLGVQLSPLPNLQIEAALVWERWSKQDRITIEPENVWIRDAVAIGDYQVGTVEIPRNMKDVYSVRVGGSYGLLDERLWVSAGVNYENSSFDDAHLTPLTFDSSKVILGLGASVEATEGLWIDVSYAHVFLMDRSVRSSQVPQLNPIRPPRSPDNPPSRSGQVTIGNGDYDLEADIVGIGMRYQFGGGGDAPPEEPEEAPVEAETVEAQVTVPSANEIELDADHDGVADDSDACPDLAGTREDGCPPPPESFELAVAFVTRSSDLDAESSVAALEESLGVLRRYPDERWVVRVHTDSQGSRRFNERISQARADAVKQWLVDRGIDPARLDTEGVGEAEPVAPNDTPEGRAQNRRVELRRYQPPAE